MILDILLWGFLLFVSLLIGAVLIQAQYRRGARMGFVLFSKKEVYVTKRLRLPGEGEINTMTPQEAWRFTREIDEVVRNFHRFEGNSTAQEREVLFQIQNISRSLQDKARLYLDERTHSN